MVRVGLCNVLTTGVGEGRRWPSGDGRGRTRGVNLKGRTRGEEGEVIRWRESEWF